MSIEVECKVDYRDTEDDPLPRKKFTVKNHWNYRESVWVTIGDKTILVNGNELIQAIKNCQNSK